MHHLVPLISPFPFLYLLKSKIKTLHLTPKYINIVILLPLHQEPKLLFNAMLRIPLNRNILEWHPQQYNPYHHTRAKGRAQTHESGWIASVAQQCQSLLTSRTYCQACLISLLIFGRGGLSRWRSTHVSCR